MTKLMVAKCPECGAKFKDLLLFYANAALSTHIAEAHPAPSLVEENQTNE